MSIVEPGSKTAGLVARAKALILQPSTTWDEIEREPATIQGVFTSYVLPLALIPVICNFIGQLVFGAGIGFGGFGVTLRFSPVYLAAQAVLMLAVSLGMVFVLAYIIDALAPGFAGFKDRVQAFKVAAYAPTAGWIAGVFGLLPAVGILALLGGLYSLFLLYRGLPKLMKAPRERAASYFAVVVVVAIVVGLIFSAIVGGILGLSGLSRTLTPPAISGTVNIPGQGSIDLGKLEAASKALEAAASQASEGNGPAPTDPDILKTYLPANIAGFTRTETRSSSGGIGGLQGAGVEGRYSRGDASLSVEVIDLGSAGALAGMAGAFNLKSSSESATGYEKVGKTDGRLTRESFETEGRRGEYSVLVADRFLIQANGAGVDMSQLKAAVGAVGTDRLERLAAGK
ncbi:Yip1 family protein [Phenylobacterium sp.]|jgi:hypothetical protein|uniref:Yip1 family protein n=1 Tax=Phenylobacterium sp. TaxID=1871053 RepID=UPI0037C9BFB5